MSYSTTSYGTVTIAGATINLTEQAYANNYGTDGAVRYYAHGDLLCADGTTERVKVCWETTPEWDEMQDAYRNGDDPQPGMPDPNDESMACDWDNPISFRSV